MSEKRLDSYIENERFFVMERIFDAPRKTVFKMFTDSKYLKDFWGPHGYELPHSTMDFRVGGEWHYGMHATDPNQKNYGTTAWGKAIYTEINEPERLAYIDYFSDRDGFADPDMPASRVTMDFIDLGSQTKLVSKTEFRDVDSLNALLNTGMEVGFNETWDRLAMLLEKQ